MELEDLQDIDLTILNTFLGKDWGDSTFDMGMDP